MDGERQRGCDGFYGDLKEALVLANIRSGHWSIHTFLKLLQATAHAFVWPADDIYAGDFFGMCLLQFMQSF